MRTTAGRIDAVDLARGVALVAMMVTHLGPHWRGDDPPIGLMVAGGRAAPLFAMLAGVALTIVHDRDSRGAGSTRATWIRGGLLIALGLALGSLDDTPVLVILAFYGLLIVVALPFRRLPTPWLLVLAAAWAVVAPVVLLWARIEHPPVDAGQADLTDLRHPVDLLVELVAWGAYPAGVWFAYVLAGLAIGRLDLRRALVARQLVAVGAVLLVVTLWTGWWLIHRGAVDDPGEQGWRLLFSSIAWPYDKAEWNQLLLVGQHTSTPLNVLSAIGSASLVIGLCALVLRVRWARVALTPIRAVGAMTLTLYTIHVLWTRQLRVDFADAHPYEQHVGSYRDWVVQVVVLSAGALLWQRLVGKGPLEWLVRRLSVWGERDRTRKNAPVMDRGADSVG